MAAVQDLLTCPICLEWFDVPKRLPCGHVYCLKHLQGLIQKDSGKLKCPECCRDHDVPNEDVNEFPLDYRLEGFINPDARKDGKCKQCKGDKNISNCDHCDLDLCQDCRKEHTMTLFGSLHYSLKEFAREYVREDVKVDIEKKIAEIAERRERNDKEQKKINDEGEAVMVAVRKRTDILLAPFMQEITILDKRQNEINQILKAEITHRELKDELEEMDCDVKEMKKLTIKLEEMKTGLDEVMENLKMKEEKPNFVDFKYQTERLHTMIGEYGQTIPDYDNMRIIRTLDGDEESKFDWPYGLCLCPYTDHVYLTNGKFVSEYDQKGNLLRKMITDFLVYGITLDSNKRLILPDISGHKVWIYDNNFKLIKQFGRPGIGDGELNEPLDAVCDEDDNIYVSELVNHRIHVFTANGDFISKFGSDILVRPFFLKITANKRLLVANIDKNSVCVFRLNGQYETNIQIDRPIGICLDRNGFILVADKRNKTIRIFTPEYEPHATIANEGDVFQDTYGIAITKSGSLFVTDRRHKQLHILQ